jgi:hypothetical protein
MNVSRRRGAEQHPAAFTSVSTTSLTAHLDSGVPRNMVTRIESEIGPYGRVESGDALVADMITTCLIQGVASLCPRRG